MMLSYKKFRRKTLRVLPHTYSIELPKYTATTFDFRNILLERLVIVNVKENDTVRDVRVSLW